MDTGAPGIVKVTAFMGVLQQAGSFSEECISTSKLDRGFDFSADDGGTHLTGVSFEKGIADPLAKRAKSPGTMSSIHIEFGMGMP